MALPAAAAYARASSSADDPSLATRHNVDDVDYDHTNDDDDVAYDDHDEPE